MTATILVGDVREALVAMDPNSVDALITDPPYELAFMGRSWDRSGVAFDASTWWHMLQVAKPGAHLIAFGGTRTHHRMMVAIEDAGWEIRDCLMWMFAQGFPKSHNLDGEWDGWGTALKPGYEPIVLARKPISERNIAANVARWGTGALNIDGCRIGVMTGDRKSEGGATISESRQRRSGFAMTAGDNRDGLGRWPANVILSHHPDCEPCGVKRVKGGTAVRHNGVGNPGYGGNAGLLPEGTPDLGYTDADGYETVEAWNCVEECPVAILDAQSGELAAGNHPRVRNTSGYSGGLQQGETGYDGLRMDSGGASRFFYVAKASREERNRGLDALEERPMLWSSGTQSPGSFQSPNTNRAARNSHPCVKPLALMQHLVRLVTPPGGTVLDPFCGSGSTLIAALREGFSAVGIDVDPDYCDIARRRVIGDAPLFNRVAVIEAQAAAEAVLPLGEGGSFRVERTQASDG